MTRDRLLAEIERLRVACSTHRDATYKLGGINALDEIAGWVRRTWPTAEPETLSAAEARGQQRLFE